MNRPRARATLAAACLLAALLLAAAGCTGDRLLPPGEAASDLRVEALLLAPENSTVVAGGTKKFAVNWRDFDGNYHLPETGVRWSASSGVINDEGEYFAPEMAGPVRIRASYAGVAASTDLVVIPNDELNGLEIFPGSIEVQAGTAFTPVLRAWNRQGMIFYPRANWSAVRGRIEVLNENLAPARAVEDDSVDIQNAQTLTPQRVIYSGPRTCGSDTVRAVIPGTVREAVCQVAVVPGPVAAVRIEPRFATVAPGAVQSFTASVEDRFGNAIPGAQVTWFATAGAIDPYGNYTAPTNTASSVVSARWMGVTGVASVNNAAIGALTRIDISPANPVIRIGDSVQFTARGVDASGNRVALANPGWETDNGSIDGYGFYYSGVAAVGPARIRVRDAGIIGETVATVVTRQ